MDLPDYASALRRRWAWLAVPWLLTIAAAAGLAAAGPPAYQSTVTLYYVEPVRNLTPPISRLNSYVLLATSEQLLGEVRATLRLDTPTQDLRGRLSARISPDTSILSLTATDTTAAGARALVTEAARQLVEMSDSLRNPAGGPSQGHLAVSDEATPPVAIGRATATRTVSLGVLLGLIIGVLSAVVRDVTDPRITHADQLRRLARSWRVFHLESGDEVLATPQAAGRLRTMRARILDRGAGLPRVVVVTSCDDSDHVTGIADVIALSAGLASMDVTLMSAHVHPRRSSLPAWARAGPGLSAVVRAECPLDEALTDGPVAGVVLLPAGRSLTSPEAVLTSNAVVAVVDDLQSRCDALLIDAPPILAHADTPGLLRATRAGVLLVVHQGRTRRRALRSAIRMLDSVQATVVGAVFVHRPGRGGAGQMLRIDPAAPPVSALTRTPDVHPITS
jgi:Mrp family chromosome partitioning ATPase